MKKKSFKVTVAIPDGVGIKDMQDYIKEAVQTWYGQLHPDNPLYNLDYKTVTCVPIRKVEDDNRLHRYS